MKSATIRACDGASIQLHPLEKRIELEVNGPRTWCQLTPHQAIWLAGKLVAMADAVLESKRAEKAKGGKG